MAVMEGGEVDHFVRIPDGVLQKIFGYLPDLSMLVHCMAVCKAWNEQAREVEAGIIMCDEVFKTYWDKVMIMTKQIQSFPRLKTLCVKLGDVRAAVGEPGSRCMRYAEIGSSVEKFVFMAAKSGNHELFHSKLSNDKQEVDGMETPCVMSLKQVVGPSDESLKKMMPVIVFAIIRGFDEFRDALPCLLLKVPELKELLIVDVAENVTINIRGHQVQQLRSGKPSIRATLPTEILEGASMQSRHDEECPDFDISFWRTDAVKVGSLVITDVSVCVATQSAIPLSSEEIRKLSQNAVAGDVLVSTISCVNKLNCGQIL